MNIEILLLEEDYIRSEALEDYLTKYDTKHLIDTELNYATTGDLTEALGCYLTNEEVNEVMFELEKDIEYDINFLFLKIPIFSRSNFKENREIQRQ